MLAGWALPVRLLVPKKDRDTYWKIPEFCRSFNSGMEMPTSCAPTPGRLASMRTSSLGLG